MRKPILLLALLLPAGVPCLAAQTTYYARLGAVGASNLIRDVIVNEITVRQSIAPLLAIGASMPISERGYRVGLEGTLSSGAPANSAGKTPSSARSLADCPEIVVYLSTQSNSRSDIRVFS